MGVAVLIAAILSLRFGITVAIFEIAAGAVAGNFFGIKPSEWLVHFAEFGSLLLIFLAGSDIDIAFLRRRLKPVAAVGMISFLAPFLGVLVYGTVFTHWDRDQLLLISIACSSTSVAIVYPVLRDSGLLKVELGKLLLLIAFLPDFLITIALFVFFTSIGWNTAIIVLMLIVAIVGLRFTSMRFLKKYGETSSEVKLRFIFAILLAIAFISEKGDLHASLAVFVMGILVSELMKEQEETDKRLRAVAFSIFVPAFYFRAGLLFSFSAVIENWLPILILVAIAFLTKFIGVYAVGKRFLKEHTRYGALLMNARLTFGTIASTYGLSHGIISQQYFSILISVIILSSAIALIFTGKGPTFAEH
jgi:Kef-type K+ transport system membrane component KefB